MITHDGLAYIYSDGRFKCREVSVSSNMLDLSYNFILPGFVDVHVHLREPGFSYKETIKSGTCAARHGGYSVVCAMPNVNPPPDNFVNLKKQLDIIERDAVIKVIPYGTITKGRKGCGEIADYESMSEYVVGFSDDGTGVSDEDTMLRAMKEIKKTGKILAAHCEDMRYVNGGVIHRGQYASAHNISAISSESEYLQIERDLKLVAKTDCRYHVCHVSTAESVKLLREAKMASLPVTFETAPHYLLLTEKDLLDEGRFKMNPPLRSERDRDALLEALADGTLDVIATDHAPHSEDEKSKGLVGSAFGIVGLETSFPLLYTYLVRKNIIPLERLIELMADNPKRIFGLNDDTTYSWNMKDGYQVNENEFLSMGKSTPFSGLTVYGKIQNSSI